MSTSTPVYAASVLPPCCPRCQGAEIRPGRIGIGDAYQYEMLCLTCQLWEDRRSDAADFDAWWQRWHAPRPETVAPTSAGTAAVTARPDTDAETALLAAVCNAPDDDAPRAAFADAVERDQPARAELIRLQLARAISERDARTRTSEPGRRELELLARHAREWVRPLEPFVRAVEQPRPDPGWQFDRGFVAFVRVAADTLTSAGERLFALAPLRHLDLSKDSPVAAALASPLLGRLHSLGLAGCRLDDDAAIALASNPHLGKLRWLDLRDNQIGERGVAALAASPLVRAIGVVLLGGNPGDPSQQYSLDWDNSVADSWLPDTGVELERRHGPIGWLHLPPFHLLADRYHTA